MYIHNMYLSVHNGSHTRAFPPKGGADGRSASSPHMIPPDYTTTGYGHLNQKRKHSSRNGKTPSTTR